MTSRQLTLFELEPLPGVPVRGQPGWRRVGEGLGVRYLHVSGWVIVHCGHPTANYPYYAVDPDGESLRFDSGRWAGRGMTFPRLAGAMAVVVSRCRRGG